MSEHGTITKTKVVLDRGLYESLVDRVIRSEKLVADLHARLDEEHGFLILALTQLASAAGSGDREFFIRKWMRGVRGLPEPKTAEKMRRRRARV